MSKVSNGARLRCSYGSRTSELGIIPPSRQANILDHHPDFNIRSFGKCQSPWNPAVKKAMARRARDCARPCQPLTLFAWRGGEESGPPAPVLEPSHSRLMCAWAGIITIVE